MQVDVYKLIELNQHGYHCSQVIMSLALELKGEDNPSLVRAMSGLNGGLGFTGHDCGVLTACCAAIGLFAGQGSYSEKPDPNLNGLIASFVEWFLDECDSMTACSSIIGTKGPLCSQLVIDAFHKTVEILSESGLLDEF